MAQNKVLTLYLPWPLPPSIPAPALDIERLWPEGSLALWSPLGLDRCPVAAVALPGVGRQAAGAAVEQGHAAGREEPEAKNTCSRNILSLQSLEWKSYTSCCMLLL